MLVPHSILTSKTFTFCLILALTSIQLIFGLHEIEVYRIIAFEESDNLYGSKVASFNLMASHFTGDLLRKLAVIHLNRLTEENLENILNKKAAGLLIVIPQKEIQYNLQKDVINAVSSIISKAVHIPVYICYENPKLKEIIQSLEVDAQKSKRPDQDDYQLIVTSDEPKLLPNLQLEDYYGFLEKPQDLNAGRKSNIPSILIIGNYDDYSLFPDLKKGEDESAVSAASVLYIIQHISEIYKNFKKIKYNVVFYLTATGQLSYQGLNQWVSKTKNSRIIGNIIYVFIIDSIGRFNTLFVQIYNSEVLSSDSSLDVLKTLNQTLTNYNIKYKLISDSYNPLSAFKVPIFRIFDGYEDDISKRNSAQFDLYKLNRQIYEQNILFLTEFMISILYDFNKDDKIIDTKINSAFLDSSLNFLTQQTRFYTQLTKDSVVTQNIYQILQKYLKSVTKNTYVYSTQKFYTHKPAKLQITKKISAFVDLYIFGGVVGWLVLQYFIFQNLKSSGRHSKSD